MSLREDAIQIWKAGVAAVDSERLVNNAITCTSDSLCICGQSIRLADLNRVQVVGAGKAGAGMARGVISALRNLPSGIDVSGWVNVPADCVESLNKIHLHAARPAGVNEPTEAGVRGTQEIIRRIASLDQFDLGIVLISGGGSALLPAPVPQISLQDKLAVTRTLASSGATIQELNLVRSQLSLVKGGGLLQHGNAKHIVTLLISDVIGDPLASIASGPTVVSTQSAADALQILKQYDPERQSIPAAVYQFLEQGGRRLKAPCPVSNHIIGCNQIALNAAAEAAQQRGFQIVSLGSENSGDASDWGIQLFDRLKQLKRRNAGPVCVLAGGETTVRLTTVVKPGRGGRNQEVVLSALQAHPDAESWQGLVLLSGGTDGEDGPTDAAGAFADLQLVQRMQEARLNPGDYLSINNAYSFFDQLDGLLRTGPTHTNVMDLAVGLVQ